MISLHDGLVLHSSISLQSSLGYSKDAWLGRSFIDYVHPNDKATFAEKLTSVIILPFGDRVEGLWKNITKKKLICWTISLQQILSTIFFFFPFFLQHSIGNKEQQTSLFCNLRKNSRVQQLDNEIKTNSPAFIPFQLTLGVKQFRKCDIAEERSLTFLTIVARPIYSPYKGNNSGAARGPDWRPYQSSYIIFTLAIDIYCQPW